MYFSLFPIYVRSVFVLTLISHIYWFQTPENEIWEVIRYKTEPRHRMGRHDVGVSFVTRVKTSSEEFSLNLCVIG